jgi:hypothetical protein
MHRSASVDRRNVATRSGAGAKKSRHQICADGGNQEHEEKLVQNNTERTLIGIATTMPIADFDCAFGFSYL